MRWNGDGASLSAPGSLDARAGRLGEGRRRGLLWTSLHVRLRRHPGRVVVHRDPAQGRRRAGRAGAAQADRRRAGRSRRLDRPERRPGRGRLPRREAGRDRGPVRRALPAAAEPRRRDDDPAPHPRVPARREPLRLRRERRRPGHRARRGRERRRGPPRGRVVHVRARRQGRDRQPRRAAGRDHVLPGRGLVRGQDGAPGEARRGSRRRRRRAGGGEARQGGPGVRARAGVHRARGPHRRASTRGSPATRRR